MNTRHRQPKAASMMIALLLAVSTTALLGEASAHQCTAEKGEPNESDCNTPCKDGEAHSHRVTHHHENGFGGDVNHIHYDCSSEDGGGSDDCSGPRVAGICVIDDRHRLAIA